MQNVNSAVHHKRLSLLLVVGKGSCRACFYNKNPNKIQKKIFFSFQDFSPAIIFISNVTITVVAVICHFGFSSLTQLPSGTSPVS